MFSWEPGVQRVIWRRRWRSAPNSSPRAFLRTFQRHISRHCILSSTPNSFEDSMARRYPWTPPGRSQVCPPHLHQALLCRFTYTLYDRFAIIRSSDGEHSLKQLSIAIILDTEQVLALLCLFGKSAHHTKCLDLLAGWCRAKFSLANDITGIDTDEQFIQMFSQHLPRSAVKHLRARVQKSQRY